VAEDFRAHERGEGFMAEARRLKVAARVVAAPRTEAIGAGRQALASLLDAEGKPTVAAAAFANDHLACGALLEARARALDVPRQLALLGFGDFAIGRELTPALSSVHVPRYEIGSAAAAALRQALTTGERAADRNLAWSVVARAST
jgi:LacI family gluconate utilization system Gnt-I transcriptional repressor